MMQHYVDLGHGHLELLLKLPSKWCILKGVLTYSLGNSYEVAILSYFERGRLEKQRGGPPRSSNSRGNTAVVHVILL